MVRLQKDFPLFLGKILLQPFSFCAFNGEKGWKYEAVFLPVCGSAACEQCCAHSVFSGPAFHGHRRLYVYDHTGGVHLWPFADDLVYGRTAERTEQHSQGIRDRRQLGVGRGAADRALLPAEAAGQAVWRVLRESAAPAGDGADRQRHR